MKSVNLCEGFPLPFLRLTEKSQRKNKRRGKYVHTQFLRFLCFLKPFLLSKVFSQIKQVQNSVGWGGLRVSNRARNLHCVSNLLSVCVFFCDATEKSLYFLCFLLGIVVVGL